MKSQSRYRWFVVGIFFVFMLLHQCDKLLIGPLTTPIMEQFKINRSPDGISVHRRSDRRRHLLSLVGLLVRPLCTGKVIGSGILHLGSNHLVERHCTVLPHLLWPPAPPPVSTTLSYPGLYSLISDYFMPQVRGKIYGLLELTMPIGYLLGMILGLFLGGAIGWRGVFYITGSLGILLSVVIFFGVREPLRGGSEPELAELYPITTYRFDWATAWVFFRSAPCASCISRVSSGSSPGT